MLALRQLDPIHHRPRLRQRYPLEIRAGRVSRADREVVHEDAPLPNRLQPNRKVEMANTGEKVSISQQGLIELEKALAMADIDVRSFRKYNRNFLIGRALALGEGVYDTRGKDFNLQLEYTGSVPQQVNKLWNCYCAHIRGLQISGENINVVL